MSKHAHDDAMTAWHRPQKLDETNMESPFKTPVRQHLCDETLIVDAFGTAIATSLTKHDDYGADFVGIEKRARCIVAAINAYASAERDKALIGKLVEAAKRVASSRHYYKVDNANDDGEACAQCGKNFRSAAHYRAGENERTDVQSLSEAIVNYESSK